MAGRTAQPKHTTDDLDLRALLGERFGTNDPEQQLALVDQLLAQAPQGDAVLVVVGNARTGDVRIICEQGMEEDAQQSLLSLAQLKIIQSRRARLQGTQEPGGRA